VVSLVKKINILKHVLVPKHRILSKKEIAGVIEKYNISVVQLPRIKMKDPIVKALEAEPGDILEIEREGPSGNYLYYRRVVE
jgi:DNA-directed RNA polymerase subunit H